MGTRQRGRNLQYLRTYLIAANVNYYSWIKRPGSFMMAVSSGDLMKDGTVGDDRSGVTWYREGSAAASTGAACGRTKRGSRCRRAVMGRSLARQRMKLWEQAGRWRRGHWDVNHIHACLVKKGYLVLYVRNVFTCHHCFAWWTLWKGLCYLQHLELNYAPGICIIKQWSIYTGLALF